MAVSKIWAVKSRLDKVLDYAANPDKTGFTEDELKDVIDYAKNFVVRTGRKRNLSETWIQLNFLSFELVD